MTRRALVRIAAELVTDSLTTGWKQARSVRCIEGLPPGAICVGLTWDPVNFEAILVFEHESFAPVEPGALPPTIKPIFQNYES